MGNVADPHTQIRATSQPCQLHKKHVPETHVNHRHHVWPLGEGGPDIEDNIVATCATGHYSTHALLQEFKIHQGNVPYAILRRFSLGERKYAELGYNRLTRGSM